MFKEYRVIKLDRNSKYKYFFRFSVSKTDYSMLYHPAIMLGGFLLPYLRIAIGQLPGSEEGLTKTESSWLNGPDKI